MEGLFVQKHVEAVRAQGIDVRVIYSRTLRDTWRQWHVLRCEGWMPDLVLLNVIQKQGLLALRLQARYGIPYAILEHWSGYLPENGAFMRMPLYKRLMARYIGRKAKIILTVSQTLQQAMRACGIEAKQWETVDNVVDGFFFEHSEVSVQNSERQKTLVNITCFDEQAKNVKGLLRAAKMLSEKRQDWRLVLIGTGKDFDEVHAYADALQLPAGLIEWTGELSPREVAERLKQADAFVLSSRYETYGVVLAEAAAAGVPILSTPVGIAEEVADLIVPQEVAQHKAGLFAEFIETILWQPEQLTKQKPDTERFTAEAIGKKLKTIFFTFYLHKSKKSCNFAADFGNKT